MSTLVIDLETTINPALPPYRPEDPKAFPPPPFWMIEVIGSVLLDDDMNPMRIGVFPGASERERVASLISFVERKRPRIVTFNGRNFDVPVLGAASMRLGVPFPSRWGPLAKRWDGPHLDLFDKLGDSGACRNPGGLEAWAMSLGWPGKLSDVHGGDVAKLLEDGKRDEVEAYCLGDVVLTTAVLFRWEHSNGALDDAGYAARVKRLLEVGRADPRLAVWLDDVDGARVFAPEDEPRPGTA